MNVLSRRTTVVRTQLRIQIVRGLRSKSRAIRSFIDCVKITACAGKGGDGMVHHYTDKRINVGPADGGSGGRGGSIVVVANPNSQSHLNFGGKRKFVASDGKRGEPKNATGAKGRDLKLTVPAGTVVYEIEENALRVVADLQGGDWMVAARGGNGGRGNASFQNRRVLNALFATPGKPGEVKEYLLELKSIADVGLVGFPNAGKSTLLRNVSSAKPRVESYPFTTMHPVIGVVGGDQEERFTIADIPGILEDAHQGRGLGIDFLRHIERTRVLAFVLDMSSPTPMKDLQTLFIELDRYMHGLREARASIIVANKLDIVPNGKKVLEEFIADLEREHVEMDVYPASGIKNWGIGPIVESMRKMVMSASTRRDPLLKIMERSQAKFNEDMDEEDYGDGEEAFRDSTHEEISDSTFVDLDAEDDDNLSAHGEDGKGDESP